MSKYYLGRKADEIEESPAFQNYTNVRVIVNDTISVDAPNGNDSGLTLEVNLPLLVAENDSVESAIAEIEATAKEHANTILQKLSGFRYKPFTVSGARLSPESTLGDGVTVNGFYSFIASQEFSFGSLMKSNIAAPSENEQDIEYDVADSANRNAQRKVNRSFASLKIYVDSIESRVETAEGNISTVTQTADSLVTRVSTAEGNISTVTQTADKINWIVKSGTSSSNFTLTDRAISLVADTIDLSGYVTFANLSTSGQTTIDGGNIKTNTITATQLSKSVNDSISSAQSAANGANFQEQLIYISKASGTNSVDATTTWITRTSDSQNTWTLKRPTYSSTYPVLFIATQRKAVDGTVTCTAPIKDDTTTVIDGGHITTGSIDASRITTGTLTADVISAHSIGIGKLSGNIKNGNWNINFSDGTFTIGNISANNITTGTLSAGLIAAGTISFSQLNSTTQGYISDALSIANGTYSGGTFINGTTIYGPEIYTNDLKVIVPSDKKSAGGSLTLKGYWNNGSTLLEILTMRYAGDGQADVPTVQIYSPSGSNISIGKTTHNTIFYGNVDFSFANTNGLYLKFS